MQVFTDNTELAFKYYGIQTTWFNYVLPPDKKLKQLINRIFRTDKIYEGNVENSFWNNLLISEYAEESQYDTMIDQMNLTGLPDRTLCVAVTGSQFHGYRRRPWVSLPGNLHLSAYLSPKAQIEANSTGFIILSAVSALQTIDHIEGLNGIAGFKWINDLFINGSKVCGVLAHSQIQSEIINGVVIGIGLNVEAAPQAIENSFIPSAVCINEFLAPESRTNCGYVFSILTEKLAKNYIFLLNGGYDSLFDFYRKRSIVIGKRVHVLSDPVVGAAELIMKGVVKEIGDNLELIFEGSDIPVTDGRLIIEAY